MVLCAAIGFAGNTAMETKRARDKVFMENSGGRKDIRQCAADLLWAQAQRENGPSLKASMDESKRRNPGSGF